MALKAAALFDQMVPFLKTNGADLVKKVNAVFHFDLSATKGGPVTSWTIDLKNGNGVYGNFILFYKSISNGKVGKADATFTMLDADFMGVAAGTLNP